MQKITGSRDSVKNTPFETWNSAHSPGSRCHLKMVVNFLLDDDKTPLLLLKANRTKKKWWLANQPKNNQWLQSTSRDFLEFFVDFGTFVSAQSPCPADFFFGAAEEGGQTSRQKNVAGGRGAGRKPVLSFPVSRLEKIRPKTGSCGGNLGLGFLLGNAQKLMLLGFFVSKSHPKNNCPVWFEGC